MSNNCLKAKSFILLLLIKSNRQKQRLNPEMADMKAWSHGVRKANIGITSELGMTELPPMQKNLPEIEVLKLPTKRKLSITLCNFFISIVKLHFLLCLCH